MMTRMSSSGPTVAGRDDLGARLLAAHPRGEEWRPLDVTVASLTIDQLIRMGELMESDDRHVAARAQLIEGIGEGELAGRLGSRWVSWADTFGLPQPAELGRPAVEILHHPYTLAVHVGRRRRAARGLPGGGAGGVRRRARACPVRPFG